MTSGEFSRVYLLNMTAFVPFSVRRVESRHAFQFIDDLVAYIGRIDFVSGCCRDGVAE